MNLLLIGLRGSGKTTIGREVAARTGMRFVDLDDVTLLALGAASVKEAWSRFGEAGFRRAEVEALRNALGGEDQVVALGGGTPTAPGALELIRAAQQAGTAEVVYLRTAPSTLRSRLEGQVGDRPSLTGADPLVEIDVVFAKRNRAYLALADAVVNTDDFSIEESVASVVERRTMEP
jgi:shikimate kinase